MSKNGRRRSVESFAALGIPELSPDQIQRLAWETGFQQRAHRKLEPVAFAALLLEQSVNGAPSYNDLAARTETSAGNSISRQAINKRMTDSCVRFFQAILARATIAKLAVNAANFRGTCGRPRRVLIQDSTVLRLPQRLLDAFSGVANANSSVCNARIQVTYDLVAAEFVRFSVDPYSKNDQKAAPELALREGDLVLRDRGYLTCDEVQRHLDVGADCIYRHKHNMVYTDPQTGAPIDLLAELERNGSIDICAQLNNRAKTPVRVVAHPVADEVANLRRMKLRKHMNGHAPSARLLRMMSWTVFITTIPCCAASFQDILDMYGLRWRIESIFKAWKSNMNFANIHAVSERQLHVLLAARMTKIVLWTHIVFRPALERVRNDYGRDLSMIKTMRYLVLNPERVPSIVKALRERTEKMAVLGALAKYCTYDRRRKRPNFIQTKERVLASWMTGEMGSQTNTAPLGSQLLTP